MNQREASVRNWTTNSGTGATMEEINSGSLQRIADAVEKMAVNYAALQNERDRYHKWWNEAQERGWKLDRRIASLRGVITKLKSSKTEAA